MLFSAIKRKRRRRNNGGNGGANAWAFIPQGAFTMGDSLDGMLNAPIRTVTLDAFYMGKYEVTEEKTLKSVLKLPKVKV